MKVITQTKREVFAFCPEQEWKNLIHMTQIIGGLNKEEIVFLNKSYAVELVVAIAYKSRCPDKVQIIIKHMMTLISAAFRLKDFYYHKPGETLKERILPICHYHDGNPFVVQAGIILLSLLSLNDHFHDLEKDRCNGKYNPLYHGMDYEFEKNKLVNEFLLLPQHIQKAFTSFYRGVFHNFWSW